MEPWLIINHNADRNETRIWSVILLLNLFKIFSETLSQQRTVIFPFFIDNSFSLKGIWTVTKNNNWANVLSISSPPTNVSFCKEGEFEEKDKQINNDHANVYLERKLFREREREWERVCVWVWERESERVSESEKVRERERESFLD